MEDLQFRRMCSSVLCSCTVKSSGSLRKTDVRSVDNSCSALLQQRLASEDRSIDRSINALHCIALQQPFSSGRRGEMVCSHFVAKLVCPSTAAWLHDPPVGWWRRVVTWYAKLWEVSLSSSYRMLRGFLRSSRLSRFSCAQVSYPECTTCSPLPSCPRPSLPCTISWSAPDSNPFFRTMHIMGWAPNNDW